MKKIGKLLGVILWLAIAVFITIYWCYTLRLGSEVSDLLKNETMFAVLLWWVIPFLIIEKPKSNEDKSEIAN